MTVLNKKRVMLEAIDCVKASQKFYSERNFELQTTNKM